MVQLCDEYKKVFKKHFGKPFPQDPIKQLELAIEAVFKSWMQPRAVKYRQVENITGPVGHGGQRAVDGVRQHGRRLGHGRGVHARSGHR